MSVIFRVQAPAGSSPHVWTDVKSQFRKPFADVSLSRSASSTVVVPVGGEGVKPKDSVGLQLAFSQSDACFSGPPPEGEVSVMCRSPLLVYSMLASTCTCSSDLMAFPWPWQALVGISMEISPAAFSSLRSRTKNSRTKRVSSSL